MLTLYHGTDKEAGNKIVGSQTFHASLGNQHWLGDGIYFYQDEYFAFRWLYLAYCKKIKNRKPTLENILNRYTILAADVNIKSDRIFDLSTIECEMIFKQVLKMSREKLKKRYPDLKIIDGAVLNLMFDKMGYKERFDAIKGIFPHRDKTISPYETRFYYTPETQYCIINRSIITDIRVNEIKKDDDTYLMYAEEFNESKSSSVLQYKAFRTIKYND